MKDNFSKQASLYAIYRPRYPRALFDFIVGFSAEKKFAWDCATGNGQSATELSGYFENIYATDISKKQIEEAVKKENIFYTVEPAEKTGIADGIIDLVTVSQALHWFDFDKFYREVKRVSKPAGIIAVWTYSLLQIDTITDALIREYHFETLKDYWDKERKYVDDGYESIPFPFNNISAPAFSIEVNWNLQDLEGYLNTWSAVQKFITINKYNPIPLLILEIKKNWQPADYRKIIFPIHLKMGYVH